MSVILNIAEASASFPPIGARTAVPAPHRPVRFALEADAAEFSAAGQALARAVAESTLRLARVREIRAAIDRGTYETPGRIEGTVKHLLNVLA